MVKELSLIIPVYNVEKYLRQCLDSVINQTLKDIEIIIINDGSTDRSYQILQQYKQKYPHLKIINQENKGYCEVRNIGLKNASGKYIGFVDSDDYIKIDMFEKLINKAVETDADIVSCNFYRFYEKGNFKIPSDNTSQIKILEKTKFNFYGAEEIFLDDAFIWNRIYKKSLLVQNNISFSKDIFFMEDTFFHRQVLLCSKKIVYIPDILYFYRQKRNGSQTTLKDERNFSSFIICDKLYDLINKKQLNNVSAWMNHLMISLLCLGYERIDRKYKKEYFEKFYQYLNKYNINQNTKIAFPESSGYNKISFFYFRYIALKKLHPMTIKYVLAKNKFMFEQIIKFRMLLSNLSVIFNKIIFRKENKL